MPATRNLILLLTIFLSITAHAQNSLKKLIDYVNPFIGTGAVDSKSLSGNTFPGATTPFGFVQLSPDTEDQPHRPSGYGYYDQNIFGFSHTHMSGTGVADLYDVLVMPTTGNVLDAANTNLPLKIIRSRFSHDQESARPGYYQVRLLDYNANAELTATEHVGFHRYTFPKSLPSHILLDLDHSLDKKRTWWPCKIIAASLKVVGNNTIEGYRILTGWGEGYRKVYFVAQFSQPFVGKTWLDSNKIVNAKDSIDGHALKVLLDFNTASSGTVLVKVGLSAVSIENAKLNLTMEVPAWDFDATAKKTADQWEKELSKIVIDGTQVQKEIFYTGMYHAFVQPNNMADVNGEYPATDKFVKTAADKKQFSTFSLWDTYRATHPLYTLIQPTLTANFVNSLLRQYETKGFLPIWQLWGLENYIMIGNHSIPVIVDAALKNIKGFDLEKAYAAVKISSTTDHKNSPFTTWEKYGYMPEDILSQSVSVTLETAYDDWCVAQLAKKLGKTADYEHFMKRSAFYKNVYDPQTRFFRGRNKDGNWLEPFDPLKYGGNGGSPYTEGNAWQYLFYVPQNINGLISLLGGKDMFLLKLDTLFTLQDPSATKNKNASGFIGQYAHGNEPSHHVAYLYDYAGQPWKTQKLVAQVLNEQYNNSFSGYSGNDDCGQMSAWYIFSAMGFYPVNPDNGIYVIGTPILKSAEIKLGNGKTFKMFAKDANRENMYIQSTKLNGKPYTKTYITQNDIANGGVLEFVMGDHPNKNWGVGISDVPPNSAY